MSLHIGGGANYMCANSRESELEAKKPVIYLYTLSEKFIVSPSRNMGLQSLLILMQA